MSVEDTRQRIADKATAKAKRQECIDLVERLYEGTASTVKLEYARHYLRALLGEDKQHGSKQS